MANSISHEIRTKPRKVRDRELVPRVMLRAVFALMLSVLALVTYARLTDQPLVATPPEGAVLAQRDLILTGNVSGEARVTTPDGTLLADLAPEEGGFIAGVWRTIERTRAQQGAPLDAPVTLIRRDTGRIEILDPATGWRADLMGFGTDNARAFARLLEL